MRRYTEKTIRYYNRIANNYFRSNAAIVIKEKIDLFISFLSGKRILDVACGPGHDVNYLTRKGFNCLGIDLSRKMINIARQNFKGKFKIMNFFNLNFKANSFDGLWCSSVFVHVAKRDLTPLLKNFKKILRNNGILGIITVKKQKIKRENGDARKYVMYRKKEFENYLMKNGYKILLSEVFIYGEKERLFIISQNKK